MSSDEPSSEASAGTSQATAPDGSAADPVVAAAVTAQAEAISGAAAATAHAEATSAAVGVEQLLAERPEVAAGAAFAGGLLLALILKRLAR